MFGDQQPEQVQCGPCMCNARVQTYVGHVHEYNRVWQIYKPDRALLKMRDSTEASVSIDTMRCRVEGSGIVIGFLLDWLTSLRVVLSYWCQQWWLNNSGAGSVNQLSPEISSLIKLATAAKFAVGTSYAVFLWKSRQRHVLTRGINLNYSCCGYNLFPNLF